jgi:hypothetical protein
MRNKLQAEGSITASAREPVGCTDSSCGFGIDPLPLTTVAKIRTLLDRMRQEVEELKRKLAACEAKLGEPRSFL